MDGATATPKAERNQAVALAIADDFAGVEASALVEKRDDLKTVVSAAESYADANRRDDGFSGDPLSEKKKELSEKRVDKESKLAEALGSLVASLRTDGLNNVSVATLDKVASTAYDGRAKISKAGWPRIFGMLVISSAAALILFALISNVASPEVLAEEKRRKEEAASKN